MAAVAIINLISTGSAGLGISEASSVKGTLLLQLCPEQLGFYCQSGMEAGLGKLLAASCNALSGLGLSGSLTCYSWIKRMLLLCRRAV